jgi:hypothetical protein
MKSLAAFHFLNLDANRAQIRTRDHGQTFRRFGFPGNIKL